MSSEQRKQLRDQLLARQEVKTEKVTIFGQEVELRQPSVEAILNAREQDDPVERALDMIIRYAFVPGTEEQIFEEGDKAQLRKWPWGGDVVKIQEAILKLTGINISEAEKELNKDPLDEPS